MCCTGPAIIEDLITNNQDLHNDSLWTPLDSFYFTSELTWLRRPKKKEISDENAIQIMVTGLLHDLQVEPRYLRIDRYVAFLSEDRIYTSLKLLADLYPESLQQVEKVYNAGFKNVFAQLKEENVFQPASREHKLNTTDNSQVENLVVPITDMQEKEVTQTSPGHYGFFSAVLNKLSELNPSAIINNSSL